MSHETLGTVLILRMESVLDIGFRVNEIACRHFNIFGNTVVCLCDVEYIFHISISFISIFSADRQDTVCHMWFTTSSAVYSLHEENSLNCLY